MGTSAGHLRPQLWAPRATTVELVLVGSQRRVQLPAEDGGYFRIPEKFRDTTEDYGFALDGGSLLPDPASPHQPHGVNGPSRPVNFSQFAWTDQDFQASAWSDAVVYELHVGTFTAQGTFDAVKEHLPSLRNLGVTHIELLPVAQFPGSRGWGYDGVNLFAPHEAYGGPAGLMRLVDACHRQGLGVLLDVVYNHLGPSGNTLHAFGPYFTTRYETPWGDALNFDGPGSDAVRRFVCDNAQHWLANYHLDGLRLDATHAMFDQTATHVLAQISQEVEALSQQLGKQHILVAESCRNDPRVTDSTARNGFGFDAQWNDDLHHALHAFFTGERCGYYSDFGTLEDIAIALRDGFVLQGQYSRYRKHSHGRPMGSRPGCQLVTYLQNHDQVGNRPQGDRLASQLPRAPLRLAVAVTLLSPFIPMLFMGEEWGANSPFFYFTQHQDPSLATAVVEGRQREFEQFGWRLAPERALQDPQDQSAFNASLLDHSPSARDADLHQWYRALLSLRKHFALGRSQLPQPEVQWDTAAGSLSFAIGSMVVIANFASAPCRLPCDWPPDTIRLTSGPEVKLAEGHLALPAFGIAIGERP